LSKIVAAGKAAGAVGAWLGVATAGAAVGFAAERYVMGRSLRRDDPFADEPFGSLRGRSQIVVADDGAPLYVEVDEPDGPADVTVLFSHGYALTQDAWHFQRRDLRGRVRQRLRENAEVVGTDEAFFEDDPTEPTLSDLYHEQAGVLDGDEDTEIDLSSYAFQIWDNAIKADPSLARIIPSLPNVVYATKEHTPTEGKPDGVLMYARTTERRRERSCRGGGRTGSHERARL
jgi:hypothetical protein